MKIPWVSGLIERQVQDKIARIASQLSTDHERVKIQVAQEMAEMMRGSELMAPVPVSYPQTGGSPYPLYGYDRPIWYATPISPRGPKPDTQVGVDTLRRFADTWDPLRSIINHLKREMEVQPFAIVAKNEDNKSTRTKNRIIQATQFFEKRGGLGEINEDRREFESKIYDDALIVGAYSVWKNLTRGGQLLQVLPIDSATIRPRMDAYGWPGPGEDWYEQWILGMLITGFKPEEIVYTGFWPITYSPYYKSPVEYLLATCLTGVKADEWNRVWLTDGNTPGSMISMPEGWQPQQIQEYWTWFTEMLSGDSKARNRMIPLPGGAKSAGQLSRKDQDFEIMEMNLIRRACAMFGVQPASIGFAGEQYKVSQEGAHKQTSKIGAGQLLRLRNELYNDILFDLGYTDLMVQTDDENSEDPLVKAQRQNIQVGGPTRTINEVRQENGDDPIEGGDIVLRPTTMEDPNAPPPEPTGMNPADKPSEGDKTVPKTDTQAEDDLNRWMRKSLKRLKENRPAQCEFKSDVLPEDSLEMIRLMLTKCSDAESVQRLFATVKPGILAMVHRAEAQPTAPHVITGSDVSDEEDEPEPDKKKKKIVPFLILILKGQARNIYETYGLLASGEIVKSQFVNGIMDGLTVAHQQAAYLGSLRAKGQDVLTMTVIPDGLRTLGSDQAETQIPYLEKFADEILAGQVSDAEAKVRASMYAQRIVGTANQGWLDTLLPTTKLFWIDTGDNAECEDCVGLAAGSPYTPETIPTLPGQSETICLTMCRCFVETEDGERSFYDPREEEIEP